jgi:hypothetical protein
VLAHQRLHVWEVQACFYKTVSLKKIGFIHHKYDVELLDFFVLKKQAFLYNANNSDLFVFVTHTS